MTAELTSSDPSSKASLFAAAQDVARQLGLLSDRLASFQHSRITGLTYVLNDAQDAFIARVPLTQVRRTAQARYDLMMSIKGIKEVARISRVRKIDRHTTFRIQPDHVRALAWALSDGRRIPLGAFRRRDLVIGLLLLIPGIIPGVLYLLYAWRRHLQYKTDVKALVMRWRSYQRPDPSEAWFDSLGS